MTLPRIIAVAVAVVAFSSSVASAADDGAARAARAGQPLIGQPAPAAVLRTLDGGTIDLAAKYGRKPVYLKFWATWCVPCREQMPGFERIYQQYGKRIDVVAVNVGFSDTEADVRAYRTRHGLTMPIALDDGSLGRRLNLRVTPQHVLIGADGRIAYVGHLDDAALHAALDRIAAARPAGAQPVALAPQAAAPRVFRVGDKVDGVDLATLDGTTAAIGTAGRPRALVFFSPWCETYLRASRPATAQACRRVRGDATRLAKNGNVDWLAVAAPLWTSPAELAGYGKTHPGTPPLALDRDGAAFAAFGIHAIPSVVLFDARGRVARVLGPQDRGLDQALRAIATR
ncbi:TlpA family protein disulfide reductase [Massilia rhizosphaerae]|uniref:TlpA family protein disulfide reductase n=1 Tax=Massilia rhizosphaerae TaxID=2784389 RepID=UPI0018DE0222|nr:redoxin family protein [Massilia rhizosphaerae]